MYLGSFPHSGTALSGTGAASLPHHGACHSGVDLHTRMDQVLNERQGCLGAGEPIPREWASGNNEVGEGQSWQEHGS